ncbi:MAG: endonuclease III [Prevotella sp.]|nr:endonuclease III [Prevotella sp.]MBR1463201.1 endonuclease III [Prevotella sp.]
MKRKERYEFVLGYFRERMPHVSTELQFGSVFQLLVATVLSAQCTDKRINQVTPALFSRYPDAKTMAEAEPEDVLEYVKSVSYPNAKSKHLVEMSRMLVESFGGEVPVEMSDLVKLPGVGRKTANVIQAVAYGKSAIAVDTHVYRVSHRMGLVSKRANTPVKVEEELSRNIPEGDRADAHHWLLLHGRYVCQSRQPRCSECPFDFFCPKCLGNSKLE